ncbi:DUF3958 family protein [Enterococcus plantarum]|uniref:DUF3958 family protein n=1 Tax=Enterococcus plantarum TaxID=1077675 RepID=UPI001A8DF5AA|nr:DUF3958 family protein [Enterococcus plantarum]MBO0421636.1 DUF3958 family protein [Enterococcus plantarum]
MSNLEEINQQKIQLEREQEKLEDLKRDLNQTEEHYEEYFFYQKQLFNELQEEFAQSQTDMLYQDMAEQINWQSRGVQDFLEEQQQELKKQTRVLEDQQEDLHWQEIKTKEERSEQHEY